MVWVDDHEERKRILMDLHVMTSHRSPYIVQYYGSIIHNVSSLPPSLPPFVCMVDVWCSVRVRFGSSWS